MIARMNTHVLRLMPGDDLRAILESALPAGVTAGCVISAVGSLSRCALRYAAEPEATVTVSALELLTLSGTLSRDGVHLHASVSDSQGVVLGGHVMRGCIVRTTAEIVIALLPEFNFSRVVDAATGYKELVVKQETP
jgi:hypothetical protein